MGHLLQNGRYDLHHYTEDEIWSRIVGLYSPETKFSTSYKYALMYALIESIDTCSEDRFVKLDDLFGMFTKIYWPLVAKYHIKQMPGRLRSSVEQIILGTIRNNKIPDSLLFEDLDKGIQEDVIKRVKTRCKINVIGALYEDTRNVMYSFSLSEEWIQFNPTVISFLSNKEVRNRLEKLNFDEWSKYLLKINGDTISFSLVERFGGANKNDRLGVYRNVFRAEFSDVVDSIADSSPKEDHESTDIDLLKSKYANQKAENYTQLTKANPSVDFNEIKRIARDVYAMSATEYLRYIGIIKTQDEKLEDITNALVPRYKDRKAKSLTEVIKNNRDITDVSHINEYSQFVYGKTAKEYLIEIDVIELDIPEKISTEEKLDNVITELKKRYPERKALNLTEVINDNPDLNVAGINGWTRELYNKTAKEYLVYQGIVEERDVSWIKTLFVDSSSGSHDIEPKTKSNNKPSAKEEIEDSEAKSIITRLRNVYYFHPAESIEQIRNENQNLDIDGLSEWINKNEEKTLEHVLKARKILGGKRSDTAVHEDDAAFEREIKNEAEESRNNQQLSAIDALIGIIEGINYDGIVNSLEVEKLRDWLDDNYRLLQNSKYYEFLVALREILSDGFVDDNEREYLIQRTYEFKSDIGDIKRSLRVLGGILNGIVCDNAIADDEVYRLKEWIIDNENLRGIPVYERVREVIGNILEDDTITENEKEFFLIYISNIAGIDFKSETSDETGIDKRSIEFESDDLTKLIQNVLEEKDGIRAKAIARAIPGTKTIDINRALYSKENEKLFTQAHDYTWHLREKYDELDEQEKVVLQDILSDVFESVKLIKQQFFKHIVDANIEKINERNLKQFGYRVSGDVAYRGNYNAIGKCLRNYIMRNEVVDLSDKDFMFNNAQIGITLGRMKDEHKIVEYDNHKYITTDRLEDMGISAELIADFCEKAREHSKGEYFNNHSLIIDGFKHPIYDFGFESIFYETLLKSYEMCTAVKINGTYVFVEGSNARGIPDIVENKVSKEESIEIYEMISFLERQYGISIQKRKLTNRLSSADVFYSDTMETIYVDYDKFFEEV